MGFWEYGINEYDENIFMDDVICETGNESSIWDCIYTNHNNHDCIHRDSDDDGEDVYLFCAYTEDSFVATRCPVDASTNTHLIIYP